MTVRDLDEMRAFKTSEARLLTRIEHDSGIGKLCAELALQDLCEAHQRYVRGDAVLQLVTPLFDYAEHNFDASEREGDS